MLARSVGRNRADYFHHFTYPSGVSSIAGSGVFTSSETFTRLEAVLGLIGPDVASVALRDLDVGFFGAAAAMVAGGGETVSGFRPAFFPPGRLRPD